MIKNVFIDGKVVIVTENTDGKRYMMIADSIQEILNDWNGDCDYVPSNDATVYSTVWCGINIAPFDYITFGELMEYLKENYFSESAVIVRKEN